MKKLDINKILTSKYCEIILKILIVFVGILIIYVGTSFITLIADVNNKEIPYKYKGTKEDAIYSYNSVVVKDILNEFDALDNQSNSIIRTPLLAEYTIYTHNQLANTQDTSFLKYFENGYVSWEETGTLFNKEYLDVFTVGEKGDIPNDEQAINSKIEQIIGTDCYMDLEITEENTVIGVANIQPRLDCICADDCCFYVSGEYDYYSDEFCEVVKIPTNNGYSLTFATLTEGSNPSQIPSNITFTPKTLTLELLNYEEIRYGTEYSYLNAIKTEYCTNRTFNEDYYNSYLYRNYSIKIDKCKNSKKPTEIDFSTNKEHILIVQDEDNQVILVGYILPSVEN